MVGWFEIPVNDMNRAKTFYETVFNIDVKEVDFGGLKMGWFPLLNKSPMCLAKMVHWYTL